MGNDFLEDCSESLGLATRKETLLLISVPFKDEQVYPSRRDGFRVAGCCNVSTGMGNSGSSATCLCIHPCRTAILFCWLPYLQRMLQVCELRRSE